MCLQLIRSEKHSGVFSYLPKLWCPPRVFQTTKDFFFKKKRTQNKQLPIQRDRGRVVMRQQYQLKVLSLLNIKIHASYVNNDKKDLLF